MIPRTGSGSSGGTSSSGRSTFHWPSASPASGVREREIGRMRQKNAKNTTAAWARDRSCDLPYKHRFSLSGSHSDQNFSTSGAQERGRGALVSVRGREKKRGQGSSIQLTFGQGSEQTLPASPIILRDLLHASRMIHRDFQNTNSSKSEVAAGLVPRAFVVGSSRAFPPHDSARLARPRVCFSRERRRCFGTSYWDDWQASSSISPGSSGSRGRGRVEGR